MKTEMKYARAGIVTKKMRAAADQASVDPDELCRNIASGSALICHNNRHSNGIPLAIGKGIQTRANGQYWHKQGRYLH